ncbi:MAG TPA: hypothetical protein VI895_09215 [Bdellovibrionota bacterium]|nr:hypothetical protein [Bdellovibrionota bacterium]
MKNLLWIGLLLPSCLSCGSSPTIRIDVDIAANTGTSDDLLESIEANRQLGISRGIYFRFTPLICPPIDINQTDTTSGKQTFTQPDDSLGGVSATKSEYSIDSSQLLNNTYYRVEMLAPNLDGSIPFGGTGDCPINLSLDAGINLTTICFGAIGTSTIGPLCAGTTPFSQCPTVQAQAQVCP